MPHRSELVPARPRSTWVVLLLGSALTASACMLIDHRDGGPESSAGSFGDWRTGGNTAGSGALGSSGSGAAPGTSGTSGGSGGTGALSGVGTGVGGGLGSTCASNADCQDPALECLLANSAAFAGQGPPKGLCSLPCVRDADCQAKSPGASCLLPDRASTQSFCFEGCTLGPVQTGDVKCHDRSELACAPLVSPATNTLAGAACVPVCASDDDCGPGAACDASTGYCTTAPPRGGRPLGSDCDPAAAADPCHGFCGQNPSSVMGSSPGNCTQVCSFGQPCAAAGGTYEGACVLITDPRENVGDLGVCAQTCNCNADCRNSGFSCIDWGNASVAARFHSAGFCFVPSAADVVLSSCGGAGG